MTNHCGKRHNSDMAGMLQLSDWEFETTLINMLRALTDKLHSIQEQMAM